VARGTIEHGFSEFAPDPTLLDQPAEGSVLRYNVSAPARILFLNSASTVTRDKMTVRISTNEGAADDFVAAPVEVGENTSVAGSHRSIVFRKFNLPWILAGTAG
jgi:sialidase-1